MNELHVDARGLLCPIPILRLAKAFAQQPVGTIAVLTATDPASVEDVEVFCRERVCDLLESAVERGIYRFRVQKR
jgi:tRNA 2-thiouridine synthesizing protein A